MSAMLGWGCRIVGEVAQQERIRLEQEPGQQKTVIRLASGINV